MKKILQKLVALLAALTMLMSMTAVSVADEAASEPVTAWLLYFANPGWWPQHQRVDQPSSETGVEAANAVITGPGSYTVGLKFNWQTAENAMQFNLVLDNAEKVMPGLYVDITDIRVNGTSIAMTADNMYGVFHDDTESGFAPIYNTYWDANHPDGAGSTGPDLSTMRAFDGTMDTEGYQIIDPAQIVAGSTIEVDFVVAEEAGKMPEDIGDMPYAGISLVAFNPETGEVEPVTPTEAWLLYFASPNWWPQHNSKDQPSSETGVDASNPTISGPGNYTAGLKFNWQHANSAIQFNLIVDDGELLLPGYNLQINDIRVNGESIAFEKNMYGQFHDDTDSSFAPIYNNYWADEGSTGPDPSTMRPNEGATWNIINPDDIVDGATLEVDFTVIGPDGSTGVAKPDPVWYGHTIGLAGLSLSDLGIENDWHNIVPVDLTKTAYHVYTLVGADAHVIGKAIVAVNNGNVSVQFVYPNGELYEKSQCIKWFTSLDQITGAELASREGGLVAGDIVNVATDLGGAEIAYLSINNMASWASPFTGLGETLPAYWRNTPEWKAYRETLMAMIPSPSITTDDVVGSITTDDVMDPSINTDDVMDPSIDTDDVMDPSIDTDDVMDPSIDTDDVVDPSVTTDDV